MSGDHDFDDFLQRRRPLFRRDLDDGLEPPAELDRIVLRQAREAIREERPPRLLNMPGWAAPVAIAATLVLGLSVVFKTGLQAPERVPEVKVESIAQRTDFPAEAPPPGSEAVPAMTSPTAPADGSIVVDLAVPKSAVPPPPVPGVAASGGMSRTARTGAPMDAAQAAASPAEMPAWRRDAHAWQAEIQRLRASGEQARAEAEQAEFNRQYRAYAVAPDR